MYRTDSASVTDSVCWSVQVSVSVDQQRSEVCVAFRATHPLILTDDVKFKFYCSSVCVCVWHIVNVFTDGISIQKSVPTGADKCQFYFCFHTTFIQDNM